MKFNLAYCGPDHLFHLRRDFILAVKYSLDDLGHDVVLSGSSLDASRFNLVIGGYFLKNEVLAKIHDSKVPFAHVNTEILGKGMLNFDPKKTDFMGGYLPSMQRGSFVWDVVLDNLEEHRNYGNNAHFLRWGWHPRMQDIEHRKNKDIDFYFFGMLSERRMNILKSLSKAGLSGLADHICPYFLRNDRISRAKVQLNLIQEDKYTHVNSFRICYLANNAACIISEREQDPANYLQYADVVKIEEIADRIRHYIVKDRWKVRGEQAQAEFAKQPMRESMAALLDASFPPAGA